MISTQVRGVPTWRDQKVGIGDTPGMFSGCCYSMTTHACPCYTEDAATAEAACTADEGYWQTTADAVGFGATCVAGEGNRSPLVYLPGMDGTGYTFTAQAALLAKAGYEVWCLRLPASDRRPLNALPDALAPLVARVAERHGGAGVTLVAEVRRVIPEVLCRVASSCMCASVQAFGLGPMTLLMV